MDENTTHKTIALRPKKERASHHKQQRQPRQQCWDVVVAWVHCWWCGPLQPRQTTCNGNNATKNKGQEGGGGGGRESVLVWVWVWVFLFPNLRADTGRLFCWFWFLVLLCFCFALVSCHARIGSCFMGSSAMWKRTSKNSPRPSLREQEYLGVALSQGEWRE